MSQLHEHAVWLSQNQAFLKARIDELALLFEDRERVFSTDTSDQIVNEMSQPPALSLLVEAFSLSQFEVKVLTLCAATEMDGHFARRFSEYCQQHNCQLDFSLCMGIFSDPHWSAILPVSPLRYWRLLELEGKTGLINKRLCIDERILHFLTGMSVLDQRLFGLIRQERVKLSQPLQAQAQIDALTKIWQSGADSQIFPIIQLTAKTYQSALQVSAYLCNKLQRSFYQLHGSKIPTDSQECYALAKLWQREYVLDRSVLLVQVDDSRLELLNSFLKMLDAPVLVYSQTPVQLDLPTIRIDIPKAGWQEQKQTWLENLGEKANYINGGLERVVSQFHITPEKISAISHQLETECADKETVENKLWQACRIQSRKTLNNLAQRIQNNASLKQLVLPEEQKRIINDILIQAKQRFKVYEQWGFAGKLSNGLGISALFHGPSGTGKTMAASVIANELQLDLFRIDLSQVVNKYIGETEKNLGKVFDAAEDCGAVLLFDEADTLFAKRTEVKSSHDRNANMETGYLLQRIEDYSGIAILTSNLKNEIDEAFIRRIRFLVQFPFPDESARQQIWEQVFPEATPTSGLTADQLAQLSVTGGSIRNIAMHAAFYAADENHPVAMRHIASAAEQELIKLEKTTGANVLRSWL